MSGYLYFPNNLKDIKDHILAYMTTVFKIKLKLIATSYILRYAYIYFCVMLIFKTKFISEQIEENSFGGL